MSTIRVKELARILKGENTSDDIQFYHDIEDNYDDNWFITSMYEDDEGDLIIESSADEDETLSVGDILDGLDDYSAGTKIYLYDSDDDEYYHIELLVGCIRFLNIYKWESCTIRRLLAN